MGKGKNSMSMDEFYDYLMIDVSEYKTLDELAEMPPTEVIKFIEKQQKINGGQ